MPQPILVLGAGSWGTALALVLARKGQAVWLWGRNPKHVAQMQVERKNSRFLPSISFPTTLYPIAELRQVTQVKEIIIAVPSHSFREVLTHIASMMIPEARICWAAKGLEPHSGLLLHQVALQVVGDQHPLAVLSGPSFAKEVAQGLPTAVTIAASDPDYGQELANLFHDHSFRPYTSTDMIGVQLGGAVKNVIAIAAGIADGLGFGANTRAALITRGLAEMVRFGTALGGQTETFMGLTGLGDLVLTCTDDQSRNRRCGHALASGLTSQQAQIQIGQVVEGIYAAREVSQIAARLQIEMPIVDHVYKVVAGLCTPQQAVNALLSRELKAETF